VDGNFPCGMLVIKEGTKQKKSMKAAKQHQRTCQLELRIIEVVVLGNKVGRKARCSMQF
jgi:hypothetical protein